MRSLGEWNTLERVSVADCAELAVAALGTLNISRPHGRFDSYIAIMREFAALPFPCALPWDVDKQSLFFEAASQVAQLINAARVWPVLPPDVVTNKMRKVLAGNAIPDPDVDADAEARNILLEFATACVVHRAGFRVGMTIEREDVRGSFDGLPDLVVECKRPASTASLGTSVKKCCSQFLKRGSDPAAVGMILIGVDRMFDGVPERLAEQLAALRHGASEEKSPGPEPPTIVARLPAMPIFSTERDEAAWGDKALETRVQIVAAVAWNICGGQFPREAPLVGVLSSLPVFVEDEGGPKIPLRMGMLNTNPENGLAQSLFERLLRGPEDRGYPSMPASIARELA
jgi:hypothetical protein